MPAQLSRQELIVAALAVNGFSKKQISTLLGLTQNTVAAYLKRTAQKLGTSGVVEMAERLEDRSSWELSLRTVKMMRQNSVR